MDLAEVVAVHHEALLVGPMAEHGVDDVLQRVEAFALPADQGLAVAAGEVYPHVVAGVLDGHLQVETEARDDLADEVPRRRSKNSGCALIEVSPLSARFVFARRVTGGRQAFAAAGFTVPRGHPACGW